MIETSALYDKAEAVGAEVLRSNLPKTKGICLKTGAGYVIGLDDQLDDRSAVGRTVLGHDIGHAATGAVYSIQTPQQVIGRCENRADKWMITNMVPRDELITQICRGLEIWELAEYFIVTEDCIKKALCWYLTGTLDTGLYYSN